MVPKGRVHKPRSYRGHLANPQKHTIGYNFPESSYFTLKFSEKLKNAYSVRLRPKNPQNLVSRSQEMDLEHFWTFTSPSYLLYKCRYKLCQVDGWAVTSRVNNN